MKISICHTRIGCVLNKKGSKMGKPKILVFASGTSTDGGSGFAHMVQNTNGRKPILNARIVGVISNHADGGVAQKAHEFGVPFGYFNGPFEAERYCALQRFFNADYIMLSGWFHKVSGLQMGTVINIHPGPLPLTAGLYGWRIHERVLHTYHAGLIRSTEINMQFVNTDPTSRYDTGKIFFKKEVEIKSDDTTKTLEDRVRKVEYEYQSLILNEVVHGRVRL